MQVAHYKQLFVQEARSKIARLEDAVILLEKRPSDLKAVQKILLVLHALKGDAATMNYQRCADAVHQLEDFFMRVRSGEMRLALEQVDACFVAIDALRKDIASIQSDDTEIDLAPAFAFTLRKADHAATRTKRSVVSQKASRTSEDLSRYRPLSSYVEVAADSLEQALRLTNDVIASEHQLRRMLNTNSIGALRIGLYNLSTQASDLRQQIVDMKLIPVRQYFAFVSRLVRDLARQQRKLITFVFKDNDMRFEAGLLESLRDVCIQLIKNAVDHGFREGEKGIIELRFATRSQQLIMTVRDTGHGFDWDALTEAAVRKGVLTKQRLGRMKPAERRDALIAAGVSSRSEATLVSGRGIGLAVVRSLVNDAQGSLTVDSSSRGSLLSVTVPVRSTLFRALTWQWGPYYLALPLSVIEKIIQLPPGTPYAATYTYRAERLQARSTAQLLGLPGSKDEQPSSVAIVVTDGERRALYVPFGAREQELIAQTAPIVRRFPLVASIAVSEDAVPVTIVDHRALR